jgi:hypothetical protein
MQLEMEMEQQMAILMVMLRERGKRRGMRGMWLLEVVRGIRGVAEEDGMDVGLKRGSISWEVGEYDG